ncbi:SIMPL domain-containing protein [Uliginosibacterium sp. sgz301328]|uniref:SIMPL domain-containing protein n=1 Tax=Uliginosibacterium sp. sgz301328 TaxID=3243764 RepID=UPI00359E3301
MKIAPLACVIALATTSAWAQTPLPARPSTPTITLSADAARPAPNDMGQVNVFVEESGSNPAELAKRVNQRINEALAMTKSYATVKTQSAGTQTFPIYVKNSTRIESWRMRSELSLQSTDIPALSELTGKLQSITAVQQLNLMPSPETQKRVADETMVDAIQAFQARAEVAARALGKHFRIRDLNVNTNSMRPIFARKSTVMMMDAAAAPAPAPIEAGESMVTVNVNGTVELTD